MSSPTTPTTPAEPAEGDGTAHPELDRDKTSLSLPPYLLHALRVTAADQGVAQSILVAQALHTRLPADQLERSYHAFGGEDTPPYPAGTR